MPAEGASKTSRSVKFVLREVELQKLHSLDILGQRFSAVIWLVYIIPGGAKDEFLSAEGAVFPVDETGRPTFRPSAAWYMGQIDYRTALDFRTLDAKIMKSGDDLIMAVRHQGIFTEVYELLEYPFDTQGLTIAMNFNCRTSGPLPMQLEVAPDCKLSMTCATACPPAKEWDLQMVLAVRAGEIGLGMRKFPVMFFTAKVRRKSVYAVTTMMAPFGFFSMLAVMQCTVWDVTAINHRAQLSLMLVLTGSAFRVAISSKTPPIGYLTLLDKYVLWCALIIMLVAIQSRLITIFVELEGASAGDTTMDLTPQWFDATCSIVFAGIWVAVHLRFIVYGLCAAHSPDRFLHDKNLRDGTAIILHDDEAHRVLKDEADEEARRLDEMSNFAFSLDAFKKSTTESVEATQVAIKRLSTFDSLPPAAENAGASMAAALG